MESRRCLRRPFTFMCHKNDLAMMAKFNKEHKFHGWGVCYQC